MSAKMLRDRTRARNLADGDPDILKTASSRMTRSEKSFLTLSGLTLSGLMVAGLDFSQAYFFPH